MPKSYSMTDVRDKLRRAVTKAGGVRAYARAVKLSAPYISDVLNERRDPGPAIAAALGLAIQTVERERLVTYTAL